MLHTAPPCMPHRLELETTDRCDTPVIDIPTEAGLF